MSARLRRRAISGRARATEVLAVTTLPDGVGYGNEGKLSRIVQTCRPVAEERLDTNTLGFRLIAYLMAYFAPTEAQQAAGARWLRCDLVRQGGKRLLPLPGTLGVGAFPYSKRVSKCLTGRQHLVTVCGQRHDAAELQVHLGVEVVVGDG